jgi:hypothetical protein
MIKSSGLFQLEVAFETKYYMDTLQDSLDGGSPIAGPQPTQDNTNIYTNCEYTFMPRI